MDISIFMSESETVILVTISLSITSYKGGDKIME